MLNLLRRVMPRGLRRQYHRLIALLAMFVYGRPSRRLIVIGVTGTDGKTTTASLITHLLTAAGRLTGLSSSAMFQVASRQWPNDSHLTMPGRFALQRLLRQMVQAGCQYAVLEVSSEGLAQYRHIGIDFDVAVLTNLTPEHIQAHGSFDNYRQAKEQLFSKIVKGGDKHVPGADAPKITVVNLDDPSAGRFLEFWAEEHYGVTTDQPAQLSETVHEKLHILRADNIQLRQGTSDFTVDGQSFHLPLPGQYNVSNALEAMAVCQALGVLSAEIQKGLASFPGVPGRGQDVPTGRPWRVVVDYALTPNALDKLYQALEQSGAERTIAVFGAAGGGRDAWKRPELGKIAAAHCAHMILTTDDPYDEPPAAIAEAIAAGVPAAGRAKVETILDRREAIRRAMQLAQPGDVIAITGMGSETSMMIQGKKVPWSDVQTVISLLHQKS